MAESLGFKCTKKMQFKQNEVRYSPYFSDSNTTTGSTTSKKTSVMKGAKNGKYGGKTEEEIMKLLLPDRLGNNMDILFVGINPGLMSAFKGHHYSGATNHFWYCMTESGLVPKHFTYSDDHNCPEYGIGLTNIVAKTTRSSSNLTRAEIKEGSMELIEKIKSHKPLITCFNGKGIYEIFSGKKCVLGRQEQTIPGSSTVVYVMPSSSARTISFPRKENKLCFYTELKQLRDQMKGELLEQ